MLKSPLRAVLFLSAEAKLQEFLRKRSCARRPFGESLFSSSTLNMRVLLYTAITKRSSLIRGASFFRHFTVWGLFISSMWLLFYEIHLSRSLLCRIWAAWKVVSTLKAYRQLWQLFSCSKGFIFVANVRICRTDCISKVLDRTGSVVFLSIEHRIRQ